MFADELNQLENQANAHMRAPGGRIFYGLVTMFKDDQPVRRRGQKVYTPIVHNRPTVCVPGGTNDRSK